MKVQTLQEQPGVIMHGFFSQVFIEARGHQEDHEAPYG